jgi:hypothetical protein
LANVTVFVDDAVLGKLPDVCVIDGIATADKLTFRQQVSGLDPVSRTGFFS